MSTRLGSLVSNAENAASVQDLLSTLSLFFDFQSRSPRETQSLPTYWRSLGKGPDLGRRARFIGIFGETVRPTIARTAASTVHSLPEIRRVKSSVKTRREEPW